MSQLLFESSFLGHVVRVFADHVEVRVGWLNPTQAIPIGQVASVRPGMVPGTLVIETSGGREVKIGTLRGRAVQEAIHRALDGDAAPITSVRGLGARVGRWLLVGVGVAIGLGVVGSLTGSKEQASDEACDGDATRAAWITARDAQDLDGFSPHTKGFRVRGRCNTTISDKMLDCSLDSARGVHGDGSILRRAMTLGFTTYACELVGSSEVTEYPIASVVSAH